MLTRLALALALLIPLSALGGPRLSHQGRLLLASGAPVEGTPALTVRLYPDALATTAVWTRTYAGVPVTDGFFALELELDDGGDPLEPAWFDGDLWVAVEVAGAGELSRQRLVDAPSAAVARAVPTSSAGGACLDGSLRYNGTTFEGCMRGGWHDLFGAAPELLSSAPAGGAPSGGATVSLVGEGFHPDAAVWFGSTQAASVSYIDAEHLSATSPAGTAGVAADLRVVNPDGRADRLVDAWRWGGARYIRLTLLNGTHSTTTISVSEVQLFEGATQLANNMTSATTPAPKSVTWTTSSYSTSYGWEAFDGVTATSQYSDGYMSSVAGSQITIDLGPAAAPRIDRYRVWTSSYSDGGGTYRPTQWTLEGSRDGSTWTLLDSYSGSAVPSGSYIERTIASPL